MSTVKWRLLVLLLSMVLVTEGCNTSVPRPESDDSPVLLRLAGSTSMVSLIRELCAVYTAQQPTVTCEVIGVGSNSGLELLRRGQGDLAMVSRELETDEVMDSRTGRRLLSAYAIAQDAIVVIVNEQNSVRELDSFSLRRLFQGRIDDWAELGGSPGEVVPVSREEGSATRRVFEEKVMSGYPVSSGAVVMPGSDALIAYVADHREAVGYVSLGNMAGGVSIVSIDGIEPSRASLLNGSYTISRPLVLVGLPSTSAEAAAFVQFVQSPRGRSVIGHSYGDPPAQLQGQP